MRKGMVCLLALFFITFCAVTVMADWKNTPVKRYDENDENVVIFIKGEGKTKEAAKEIQKKVNAEILDLEKATFSEIDRSIKDATLFLVGLEEGKTDIFATMEEQWDNLAAENKKVSLFYVSSGEEEGEKELTAWEERLEYLFHVKEVPGLALTWKEENRERELSYIDGWLTTAFTY